MCWHINCYFIKQVKGNRASDTLPPLSIFTLLAPRRDAVGPFFGAALDSTRN
jgi:hypothetical protein